MKWIIPALCAVLAAASCMRPVRQPEEPAPIRIAAWNIEHLTAAEGEGCRPRTAEDLDLVADYIRRVEADIWLLQEVDGEAALRRVFGDGWTFHVEERPPAGPYPLCYGREDGARLRAQNTAIAVRSSLAHVRLPDLSALDLAGDGMTRYGVAIRLSAGTPLDIMSVHLASGCNSGAAAERCARLFDQAKALEAWIDEAGAAGRAVLVGGDFNRRLEAAGDTVWPDLNDGAPSPLYLAGAGTGPKCDPRYTEFIDFMVLNEVAMTRIRNDSFQEWLFDGPHRPSDHCPIAIQLAP